jgi:hypothetical protein
MTTSLGFDRQEVDSYSRVTRLDSEAGGIVKFFQETKVRRENDLRAY